MTPRALAACLHAVCEIGGTAADKATGGAMSFFRFEHASVFPVEVEVLWRFHMRPELFHLLNPPEMHVQVIDPDVRIKEGTLVDFFVGRGPLAGTWAELYTAFDLNRGFTDVSLEGPLPFWEHRHEFEVMGRGRSMLRDVIWYSLPGLGSRPIGGAVVEQALRELFAWRHARTLELVADPRPPRPRRATHGCRALVRPRHAAA
jgi:ligand-binding SRPBCC domain-containing protein